MAEAIPALERARQLDPEPRMMAMLAYAYGVAGNRGRADAILGELTSLSKRRYVSPFAFVVAHAGLDNRDQAFTWLERALHERSDAMAFVAHDPLLESLRTDERFERLMAKAEGNRYH
jgi:hypothetical protein